MRLPYVWFRFVSESGERWTVFLSTRAASPCLRRPRGEEPYVGITLFRKCRIYIELGQTERDIQITTLHELMHVAYRPMKFPAGMDEDIVAYGSEGLSPILEPFLKLPEIPHCLRGRLRS